MSASKEQNAEQIIQPQTLADSKLRDAKKNLNGERSDRSDAASSSFRGRSFRFWRGGESSELSGAGTGRFVEFPTQCARQSCTTGNEGTDLGQIVFRQGDR